MGEQADAAGLRTRGPEARPVGERTRWSSASEIRGEFTVVVLDAADERLAACAAEATACVCGGAARRASKKTASRCADDAGVERVSRTSARARPSARSTKSVGPGELHAAHSRVPLEGRAA